MPLDSLLPRFESSLEFRTGTFAWEAARRLGRAADPRAVDIAIKALSRPRGGRWSTQAVMLLQLAGAHRAVPTLVACLPGGSVNADQQLTHAAMTALGAIGSPDALQALLCAAEQWPQNSDLRHTLSPPGSPCGECAQFLVQALCHRPTPQARDAVLDLTRQMESLWGAAALYAVARVADERFVPFLVELCAGPARDCGLAGLERTATQRAVPALLQILGTATDRRTRHRAARALATAGFITGRDAWNGWQDRPDLVGRGADPRVRRSLVWAAGRTARPVAADRAHPGVGTLVRWLQDPDDLVRAHAVASLGLLARDGDRDARYHSTSEPCKALIRALDDPSYRVRAHAATALGRIGVRYDSEELHLRHAAMHDPVRCVRDAAEAALRAQFHPARKIPPTA